MIRILRGNNAGLKILTVVFFAVAADFFGAFMAAPVIANNVTKAIDALNQKSLGPAAIYLALLIAVVTLFNTRLLMYIVAALAFVPYTISAGANITPSDLAAAALALSVALHLRPRPGKFGPLHVTVIAYALVTLFSLLNPVGVPGSLSGLLKPIEWGLIIFYSFSLYGTLRDATILMHVMSAACTLLAVAWLFGPLRNIGIEQFTWNKNYIAGILDMGVPLTFGCAILQWRKRHFVRSWGIAGCVLIQSYSIATSSSLAALVGLVAAAGLIGCAYMAPRLHRRLVLAAPIVLIAASIAVATAPTVFLSVGESVDGFTGRNGTASARVIAAQLAFQVFQANPLLGVGAGHIHDYLALHLPAYALIYLGNGVAQPHNFFLYILAETGALGALVFAIVVFLLAGSASRVRQLAVSSERGLVVLAIGTSLLAYLTRSLFDLFDVRGTGTMFWLLLGLIYGLTYVPRAIERVALADATKAAA